MKTDETRKRLKRMGEAIRDERRAQNLSQKMLGNMIGTSQGYVSELENGVFDISVGRLLKIAEALDVDPGNFLR